MTNQYWKMYPTGSARQVVAHAEYRRSIGKNPSMTFMGVRNSRKALVLARFELDRSRATVRNVNGQMVLDDPDARGMIDAVNKHNCESTFHINADRVTHFKNRFAVLELASSDMVIVLLNVNDEWGSKLAQMLMPGTNWQEFRDRGQIPYARGLANRDFIQKALDVFDALAAAKLREMTTIAVVVVDYRVAEVFAA
jgi:hypothetical protein